MMCPCHVFLLQQPPQWHQGWRPVTTLSGSQAHVSWSWFLLEIPPGITECVEVESSKDQTLVFNRGFWVRTHVIQTQYTVSGKCSSDIACNAADQVVTEMLMIVDLVGLDWLHLQTALQK